MRGHIVRRGKDSWRLKFDVGTDAAGKRCTRYQTVRGTKADAQRELTKLLASVDRGTLVEPTKTTIAEYIRAWLDGVNDLAPKTLERYRELAERQIFPHIGTVALQKLRPSAVAEWHAKILTAGGQDGKPLSPRTVGHAHRLLSRALERAVETEVLARNVASAISPPKIAHEEIEILGPDQVALVLMTLSGHELHAITNVALATGMRRGELLGLQLRDIDLDAGLLSVERSLEETAAGLRFKPPKTKHGRRTISLPSAAVDVLRDQRRRQLENRLALGLGRPPDDALVFCTPEGTPLSPRALSRLWLRTCVALDLPRVNLHALRHTHASALIAAGVDVVTISRRLGHANPTVTLNIYAHLFRKTDTSAAAAIDVVLRG